MIESLTLEERKVYLDIKLAKKWFDSTFQESTGEARLDSQENEPQNS